MHGLKFIKHNWLLVKNHLHIDHGINIGKQPGMSDNVGVKRYDTRASQAFKLNFGELINGVDAINVIGWSWCW